MTNCFHSIALLTLCCLQTVQAASITGKVVKVADGDTVTVLANNQRHRVRLAGIDAPERKQAYGNASGRSLRALLAGKQVRVEYNKRDRYGRIVGLVRVQTPDAPCASALCPKTLDAGLYQITVGLAWWYRRYAHEQTPEQRGQYEVAEREAQSARIGLWQEAMPVALWDWRRGARPDGKAIPPVVGNKRSRVYHVVGCRSYAKVSQRNQVAFQSTDAARNAGFRRAGNCP
jgi:endonuclease YncB( thermonuclease family)